MRGEEGQESAMMEAKFNGYILKEQFGMEQWSVCVCVWNSRTEEQLHPNTRGIASYSCVGGAGGGEWGI